MPSPMGPRWLDYIDQRLRMCVRGMDVYATDRYAHTKMDKYIESARATDTIAKKITQNKPTIVFMGASETAPSTIISVRGHVRAPGNKKWATSFRKCGGCIKWTDEYNTSQFCGRCVQRFDARFRSKRFKTCFHCNPSTEYNLMLPRLIVNEMAHRKLKRRKADVKRLARNGHLILQPIEERKRLVRLFYFVIDFTSYSVYDNSFFLKVSKIDIYRKNWQPNQFGNLVDMEADAEADADIGNAAAAADYPMQAISKTVWHRDITAARLIFYKGEQHMNIELNQMFLHQLIIVMFLGHCQLYGIAMHPHLQRPADANEF